MSCLSRTPSPEDEAMYDYAQAPPLPSNPVPPTRAAHQRQRLQLSRQDAHNFNAPRAQTTSNASHVRAQPTLVDPSVSMPMGSSQSLLGRPTASHAIDTGPVTTWTTRPAIEPTFDDPRVTIDHTAYPHIFDGIYEQTPPPRRHFRLLHRSLKDKVDNENEAHLGLVDKPNARALGLRDRWRALASALGAHHVFQPITRGRSTRGEKVLDIVGFPPTPIPTELNERRIPILRLIPTPIQTRELEKGLEEICRSIQADTIVMFSRTRRYPDENRPILPSSLFQARRLVVYVGPPAARGMTTGAYASRDSLFLGDFHNDFMNFMVFRDFRNRRRLRVADFEERTLIFDPKWARWKPQSIPPSSGGIFANILDITAERMSLVDCADRPRLTLVGLELLPSATINGPVDLETNQNVNYLCEYFPQFPAGQDDYTEARLKISASLAFRLMKLGNNDWFQRSADGVQEREAAAMVNAWISFRTCEEYMEIVGPKQWRIETVGYLWHMEDEPDHN